MQIKVINWLEKVFLDSEPKNLIERDLMLNNERYSFQFAYNFLDNNATYFTVDIDSPIKDYIKAFKVGNIAVVNATTGCADDYYLSKKSGLYPDILAPLKLADKVYTSAPLKWEAVWVTVEGDLPVGTFDITIKFNSIEEDKKELGRAMFTIEVIDEKLPKRDLTLTNWIHIDCICEQYNVAPYSKKFYEIFDNYLLNYARHGNTMIMTPTFTPALDTEPGKERMTVQLVGISINDGKYSFDFSKLSEYIFHANKAGIFKFEMAHLFTQWGAKFCPKIMATVDGEYKKIFGWENSADSPEYFEFLQNYLPALVEFLDKNNIEAYFHLSDEPQENAVEHYSKLRNFVKPLLGKYPTMDALSSLEFYKKGVVDIPVVCLQSGMEYLKADAKFWLYYCWEPCVDNYTNRHIAMPSLRTSILGVQLYHMGVKGFLHWGYNFSHSFLSREQLNPYVSPDALGAFPAGDTFMVYPDIENKAVIDSLRHEVFYNGLQIYLMLKLVEQKKGKEFTDKLLKDYGINGLTEYPHCDMGYIKFISSLKEIVRK